MSGKDEAPRRPLRRFLERFRRPADADRVAEETLSDLQESGVIDSEETEMMQSVLELDKTTAREIFVPRTEIVAIAKNATLLEVLGVVMAHGHNRFPVVDGDLDQTLGFLRVKDLLQFWGRESEFDLPSIVVPALQVPETKKLDDLLTQFQQSREKIALVVDEFGGVSGLVTITDILEEIVGEFGDEIDRHGEARVYFGDRDTLVVPGRYDIDGLREHFGGDAPEGAFNTAGGWIFDRIGRVPQAGEVFDLDGFRVRIEAATERQIRRLRVQRPAPDAE